MRRHKIKREMAEPSSSYSREQEEHDLAYYIHDRVELMHQVFSVLKPKDVKAMTPACIRHLSVDNVKELCTEELLGISSKRLCAILDGAEPPTDTESSLSASPERFETISLDSISSDEEILSQTSKKSKKKHRHREKTEKSKKKKKTESTEDDSAEKSKASRAGLTVLELLELQARARAIRAQLQQEQAAKKTDPAVEMSQDTSSDDEVLVKEEPPEVVEISSDDEKPSVAELEKDKQNTSAETETIVNPQKVTKRVNNLVITVPQTKPTRKIKLNRTKSNPATSPKKPTTSATNLEEKTTEKNKSTEKTNNVESVANKIAKDAKVKVKLKKNKKKKGKRTVDNNNSDDDEITLQLSDSEKLDLLENLDRKNFDRVSSQTSEDSESSSSSSESDDSDSKHDQNKKRNSDDEKLKDKTTNGQNLEIGQENAIKEVIDEGNNDNTSSNDKTTDKNITTENVLQTVDNSEAISSEEVVIQEEIVKDEHTESSTIVEEPSSYLSKFDNIEETLKPTENLDKTETNTANDQPMKEKSQDDNVTITDNDTVNKGSYCDIQTNSDTKENYSENDQITDVNKFNDSKVQEVTSPNNKSPNNNTAEKESVCEPKDNSSDKNDEKQMSDGELSDRDSSEVEATELQPEVVCISDDEGKSKKSKKKHKKKEKRNKKEKKSKKTKSDFRSGSDQNFYKDNIDENTNSSITIDDEINPIVIDEDDIFEILELSDDSSCYEVEGTVLSKEPTAEEIEALSAKIDEIERVEVITEEEIREHERSLAENSTEDNLEHISWRDRYLGSTKVKRVLTTSNIMNAMRKKNKQLKKMIEESKNKEEVQIDSEKVEAEKTDENDLEEGSIEQYNTLQGSTKYVDPVRENIESDNNTVENTKVNELDQETGVVTKEMKKDAKQLLKMYRRLLKYNDMNKQKDPKKKKKKQKKSKDSECVASVVNSGA